MLRKAFKVICGNHQSEKLNRLQGILEPELCLYITSQASVAASMKKKGKEKESDAVVPPLKEKRGSNNVPIESLVGYLQTFSDRVFRPLYTGLVCKNDEKLLSARSLVGLTPDEEDAPASLKFPLEKLKGAVKPLKPLDHPPPIAQIYDSFRSGLAAWDGNDPRTFDLEEHGLLLVLYAIALDLGYYEIADLEFTGDLPEKMMSTSDLAFLYCMLSAAHLYDDQKAAAAQEDPIPPNGPVVMIAKKQSKSANIMIKYRGNSVELIQWLYPMTEHVKVKPTGSH